MLSLIATWVWAWTAGAVFWAMGSDVPVKPIWKRFIISGATLPALLIGLAVFVPIVVGMLLIQRAARQF